MFKNKDVQFEPDIKFPASTASCGDTAYRNIRTNCKKNILYLSANWLGNIIEENWKYKKEL